ncbi:MAG: hypothetical protein AAGJ31_03965 [Verrucomicrobiota bacterium]
MAWRDTGARVAGKNVDRLPSNPVFTFDGEAIEVLERGSSEGEPNESFWEEDWPPMIDPDDVMMGEDGLILRAKGKRFRFESEVCAWKEFRDSPSLRSMVAPFEPVAYPSQGEIAFRRAVLEGKECLHDSRGLLHLRSLEGNEKEQMSLLLIQGLTSVWCEDLGVSSLNESLLPSGSPEDSRSRLREVDRRFRHLFRPPS